MLSKLRALIVYLSYSGNTKEVEEIIRDTLTDHGAAVDMDRSGWDSSVSPKEYDLNFFGTFTWGKGETPDEVKEFVL